jgi:hypothetical protein
MNGTKQVATTRAMVFILAAALFLAVLSGCGAQTATLSNPSDGGSDSSPGALTADPTTVSFGSLVVGSSTTQTAHITNAGPSKVTISKATVAGSGYSVSGINVPVDLPAGQGLTYTVTYKPSSTGSVNGSLTLVSDASNSSFAIAFSGTGVAPGTLTANPTTISFGSLVVGNSTSQTARITNAGTSKVTISSATVAGSGYSVSGVNVPLDLAAGQTLTYTASYKPSSAGSVNGSLTLVSDASNSNFAIVLSGTGIAPGQLTVSPSTLSFGSVNVGQNKSLGGTVTAGSTDITVSSATLNGTAFSLSGITFPKTIAAGQSATFTVSFAPSSSGTSSGSVSFVSNASNSPGKTNLSGTGVQVVAQHSVSLSWMESSGSVQGYYVYRGGQSGGPYSRTSSLLSRASYSDSSVTSGSTYYYVVTAVGTNSQESAYSNEVQALIP